MRALVFGGTGMLGQAIAAEWRRHRQPVLALDRRQADVTDTPRLVAWAERFRPQLIINCAAFTRVDDCEEQREKAITVNGRAVANVVAAAEHVGAELIQISSDYVFDGRTRQPYATGAATGPISVYGESKLRGEAEALRYPRALVVRASWLFGPGGPNFVATIRSLLLDKVPLKVVDDQVGSPTYTPFLARALRAMAPHKLRGVLHYCNREPVSWHGFACEISRATTSAEVVAVPTSEFPRPAARPPYSVLDVTAFEAAVGRRVEPWISGLVPYLETLGDPV